MQRILASSLSHSSFYSPFVLRVFPPMNSIIFCVIAPLPGAFPVSFFHFLNYTPYSSCFIFSSFFLLSTLVLLCCYCFSCFTPILENAAYTFSLFLLLLSISYFFMFDVFLYELFLISRLSHCVIEQFLVFINLSDLSVQILSRNICLHS